MNPKLDPLHFKLTHIKRKLEDVQENLGMNYNLDETIQEIIELVDEAIILYDIETG